MGFRKDTGAKTDSSLNSAHGDKLVAESIAITQVSAEYGFPASMLIGALGGSVTTSDGVFNISTGTGANNVSAAISSREANHRPGQGLSCIISTVFAEALPDLTQQGGFISSEASYSFGYNGTEFGVLEAYDGVQEHQELTVTTAATGAETATVTLDGVAYSVPLTASTTQQNAYEIAKYLEANEPRYRATSNDSVVTILATLPDFGGGSFSFSSATAVASWVQISAGALPTESWTPKADWNKNNTYPIDPQKLNTYKIQVDGNINFYVKGIGDSGYILVHTINRLNSATGLVIKNPTFRVGWGIRNKGSVVDSTMKGVYASSFNEGYIDVNTLPFSDTNTQLAVDVAGAGEIGTNVLALRSRTVFGGVPNRAEILPQILSFGTGANKTAIFQIVANPTVATGESLEWGYLDETNSVMESAKNKVQITGGNVVASFSVTSGGLVFDIDKLIPYQVPFSYFAIVAKLSAAGTPSEMIVNATWKEDK